MILSMPAFKLTKFLPFLFLFLLLTAAAVGWILISRIKNFSSVGTLGKTITAAPSLVPAAKSEEKTEFILGNLLYPGAKTIRLSGDSLYLKSSDSPERIAVWYKERIGQMKMAINNFVQTNVNGKTANLLNAADERGKITVEINRRDSEAQTEISVNITAFK